MESTNDTGVDVVINTSNSWEDWFLAIKLVAKGGTIVNLGFPGRDNPIPPDNPFDTKYVYTKNVTIKAMSPLYAADIAPHDIRFNLKRNLGYIVDLIATGKLKPSSIITDEVSWDEIESLYDSYADRKKVMFTSIINWEL